MPKLAKTLLTTGSMRIGKRRTTKRFWYIIGILLALIIISLSTIWIDYASLWDRLWPDRLVTTGYWQGVFYDD
mgnify:CR=1 FL=1